MTAWESSKPIQKDYQKHNLISSSLFYCKLVKPVGMGMKIDKAWGLFNKQECKKHVK